MVCNTWSTSNIRRLTIFPIAAIIRDNFGKATGVVAAWLIAFMPAHVSHSTWAFMDHDAFVMLSFQWDSCSGSAIKHSGNERLTKPLRRK